MHTERMRLLERTLERVIAEDRPFYMGNWFMSNPHDCGTAACAGGWLCREPEANAQGLAICGSFPTYKGQYGIYALAFYLDVAFEEADWLFSAWHYPDQPVQPTHVLAKVRSLMKWENNHA